MEAYNESWWEAGNRILGHTADAEYIKAHGIEHGCPVGGFRAKQLERNEKWENGQYRSMFGPE